MGAATTPHQLPVFRADMFEFGEREVPLHANRLPVADSRNKGAWGIQGILAPHIEVPRIIAANIVDEDVLHSLVLARFRKLTLEYPPDNGHLNGNEVQIMLPLADLQPRYEEGVRLMHETAASMGGAANLGAGVEPVAVAA